jgi:hypothetical protein
MIAPPDIPWAQFQGLTCRANYHFRSPKTAANKKAQCPEPAPFVSQDLAEEPPPSHKDGLTGNPKRSRKVVVAQEGINNAIPSLSSIPSTASGLRQEGYGPEEMESLVSEAIAEMSSVLNYAFRKLIGVKGVIPGMRSLKRMVSPSLIDIAPAVWDLQYLQVRPHLTFSYIRADTSDR